MRVLVRPVIGEAMLAYEEPSGLLNGLGFLGKHGGWVFEVEAIVTAPDDYSEQSGAQAQEVTIRTRPAPQP